MFFEMNPRVGGSFPLVVDSYFRAYVDAVCSNGTRSW